MAPEPIRPAHALQLAVVAEANAAQSTCRGQGSAANDALMSAVGPLILAAFVVCAIASPTSRRRFRQWTRSAWGILPRRLPLRVVAFLFVACLLLTGWAALIVIGPGITLVDVLTRAGQQKDATQPPLDSR
jgi:hypothetical protein